MSFRRPITAASVSLVTVAVVILAVVMSALAVLRLRDSESDEGYRMRVVTQVPSNVSVRPEDVSCPLGHGPTPVDYTDVGTVASDLPLYDGDLIAVRFEIGPGGTSAMRDEIRFLAAWPEEVVGDGVPRCVFVVSDGPASAVVNWRSAGERSTEFVVLDPDEFAPTTIEVWLVADDPIDRAVFRTDVVAAEVTDDVVIDPVGGQTTVRRRIGAPAEVNVAVAEREVENEFDVVARVENTRTTTRALDVVLSLWSVGVAEWEIDQLDESGDTCTWGSAVECRLGDLSDGEGVVVSATLTLPPDWAPTAVTCDAPLGDSGFGFCVSAETSAASGGQRSVRSTDVLVPLPRPPMDSLAIRTDPDPVLARAGSSVGFSFTVSAPGNGDLASVEITGSDCAELTRVSQPFEDGDAFLEAGEVWRYDCILRLERSPTFRFDVSARDAAGNPVTASYEGTVILIDAAIEVEVASSEGEVLIRVRNSGADPVYNVAARIPGCRRQTVREVISDELASGATVEFLCESATAEAAGVVVYAIDKIGLPVVVEVP